MAAPIISVDFDGVIHSYASGWQGPTEARDGPMPGAMEALREYSQHFRVDIFSSRSNLEGGIPTMIDYITRHAKLEFGDRGISWTSSLVYPTVKPPARVSIDDRAITFTGRWPTVQELMEFKPFYLK